MQDEFIRPDMTGSIGETPLRTLDSRSLLKKSASYPHGHQRSSTHPLRAPSITIKHPIRRRNPRFRQPIQPGFEIPIRILVKTDVRSPRHDKITVDLLLFDEVFDLFDLAGFEGCDFLGGIFAVF